MTAIDIILTIIAGLCAITLSGIMIKIFCIIFIEIKSKRRTEKLKKNKQEQNKEIKSLKDRLEYLELKQSGAKIKKKHIDEWSWGQYYIKYAIDETVKEVQLPNATMASIENETDKYIVLIFFGTIGHYYYILDKATGEICDINQLLSEKTKIEEKIKILNSIEKENKTNNMKQSTTKAKRKVGRPKNKK